MSQLEEQWKKKQAEWTQQAQKQQDFYATQLAQTKAEHSEELKQKQTKITELTEWSAGQHNRILELENQASVLELKLETNQRELEQKEQEWIEQKQALTNQHQQALQEQKEFYLEKVSGLENTIQTNEQTIAQLNQQITAQQTNITNLQAQNQTSTATIRTNTTRITQLEEYLRTSQQDNQAKQRTIQNLNQEKVNLQTQITQLTQAQTETTRTLNEQTETITNLNRTLARQRGVLEQLLVNFKIWLEAEPTRKENLPEWPKYLKDFELENHSSWKTFLKAVGGASAPAGYTDSACRPYREVFRKFIAEQKAQLHQEIQIIKEVLHE